MISPTENCGWKAKKFPKEQNQHKQEEFVQFMSQCNVLDTETVFFCSKLA